MTDLVNSETGSWQKIAHLFSAPVATAGAGAPQLVICGFGRLGRAVADACIESSPSRIWVIERDHEKAELARTRGLRVVCGDATDSHTQRVASVGLASQVAVCIDPPATEHVVRVARALSPSAHVRVGISEPLNVAEIRSAGANEIVILSDIAGQLLATSVLPQ